MSVNVEAAVRWYARNQGKPESEVNVAVAIRHYQAGLRSSREAKRRLRGSCAECDAPTRYNGHRGRVSRLCLKCAAKATAHAKRGTGPRQAQILALLAEGPLRYWEIRDALGMSNGLTAKSLHHLFRYGLVYRPRRGVYALVQTEERE